jgi:glycogen debranching enzyme
MKSTRFPCRLLWLSALALIALLGRGTDTLALDLDSLAIRVAPDRPREFLYTDKGGAHLFGEALGPPSRSYHGLYSHMHEFLDGWDLQVDGHDLGPAIEAKVYPDRLVRRYATITETVTLLDREPGVPGAALLVEFVPKSRLSLRLAPQLDIRFVWEEVRPDYDVRWEESRRTLLVASRRHLQRTPAEDWPVWMGFACASEWSFRAAPSYEPHTYPKDEARHAMARATPYRPGSFEIRCDPEHPAVVCVVLANDAEAAALRADAVLKQRSALVARRRARMQDLVDRPGLESSDARLDRAAAWCRLGMDQLVMEQRGVGIYAGYPWFTTYWGRDSFISLPGACLVTGDFETARTILRTFAERQDADPRSAREGRLPNFVTTNQVQFAGVDGTWWWVRALHLYEQATGDVAFADSLYPVVKRAIEGALRHAVDTHGFLLHGDGETWMDAGGEAHPYSPRGDRAVEVQALFASGLAYGIELAERQRERGDYERWRQALDLLRDSFGSSFFDAGVPYDHLNVDGTPDHQVRPNGLLAWYAAPDLFTHDRARATIERVRDRLAYPWSVGSLAADDPQFRPVHLALDRYYFDEAYHNGDVWLWLSGPLVSGLVSLHQENVAWQQTQFLVDEILDRGVAGSLREIRDAIDTPGKDEYGGAVAQAWSLAEMQRTLFEDYLGVRPEIPAGSMTIAPLLPDGLTHLAATVPAGHGWLRVEHEWTPTRQVLRLTPEAGFERLSVRAELTDPAGRRHAVQFDLDGGRTRIVVFGAGDDLPTIDGKRPDAIPLTLPIPPRPSLPFGFQPPAVPARR